MAAGTGTVGSSVGDCVDDTFSVSSSGKGSPVICGTNSGQHSNHLTFLIIVWVKLTIPVPLLMPH